MVSDDSSNNASNDTVLPAMCETSLASSHTQPVPSPSKTRTPISWRLFTYLWTLLLPVRTVITFLYVTIALLSFHWVYLGYMEDIRAARFPSNRPSQGGRQTINISTRVLAQPKWTHLTREMARRCHMTLVFLTSCFSLGAYVAQNSTKLMPRVLGHILMFMSGDGIMNSVVILVFMHILNVDDRITNGYMDHLRRSALVKLAKIFAIPIATLLWSLFLCVTSVISYITQPDAPELQTPTYERRSHHHETQEHVPDGPQDSDQTPLPTIVQKSPMPQAVVIALGNFAALLLLRFIWVIHGIVRIRRVRVTRV